MSKEFNFDELDKAVSSLIGDQPKQPAQTQSATNNTTASQPSPPITPSRGSTAIPSRHIPPAERIKPSAPATPSLPLPSPPAPAKPAVEKSNVPKRFMDVVHPASGMAPPVKEMVKKGAGAEGKTITPLNDNIAPDPLPENSAANTPNSAQLSVKAPVNPDAMVTTPDTEEKKWKDPLEEVTKNEKEREITESAKERLGLRPKNTAEDSNKIPEKSEKSDEKDSKEDDKKPLFLPDAKVEKRPLGAFAEKDTPSDKAKEKEKSKNTEAEEDAPVKLTIDGVTDIDDKSGEEPSEPLLPELGKEIIAVEAGDAIAEDEDQAKVENKEKPDKKEKKKDETVVAKSETFSIPKQYKEKPATDADRKPTSIYDTEEYHRSIVAAATKQKKGGKWWMWALIVFGLLVVGVGLGAGAYFLMSI